jgi:PAS domain S-box-containing protein
MDHSVFEPEIHSGLSAAITALSQAPSQAALIETLQTHLIELTNARALQLMWQANGMTLSLFQRQPTLRLPTEPERERLLSGMSVTGGNTTYFPMLALGELRGWVALQAMQQSVPLQGLILQAGMALSLLERQSYQSGASRELVTLDKIGRLLSSTLQLEQLLPNLAVIVRELIVAQDFYIVLRDSASDDLSFAYWSTEPPTPKPSMHWSINDGLTGVIIRSGRPIITDNYLQTCQEHQIIPGPPHGPHYAYAWMGMPLTHHDQVLGAMVAMCNDPDMRYTDADAYLFSAVAAQAAAAVANAQLYKRVKQQATQLAMINKIGRAISATLDPQEIPLLIMHELKAALDVEDGALLIEDRLTGDLVVRHTLAPQTGLRMPKGTGLAGEALRLGAVQIANNLPQDSRLYAPFDGHGVTPTSSLICAPLTGRQQLRGIIQLRNKRSGPFSAADAQLLEAIAEQAAVALENAELYSHTDSALAAHIADLEQRNQQLTNIVAISNALRSSDDVHHVGRQIVMTIQAMTKSPRIAVGLVDPERQQVRTVAQIGFDALVSSRYEYWTSLPDAERSLQESLKIGTVTHRVGQHALAAGFINCIVLALRDSYGQLVGAIGFDLVEETEPLSNALIQELEIVANQAAIAIVNARLASEQEHTVNRLTALNALSLAVTTSRLSTDDTMRMTISGAIGTTNGLGGGAYVTGRDDVPRRLMLDLPIGCDDELAPLLEQVSDDYVELVEPDLPPALAATGARSLLIVPVRGAKLTLGSLWIAYNHASIAATEREMVVLYAKTAGGVLENLRLLDQISAAHDRLASILASTTEGMLMATAQGMVAAANSAFISLLGLSNDTLEGLPLSALRDDPALTTDSERLTPLWETLMTVARGEPGDGEHEGEVDLTTPTLRNLAWSALPVHGQSGEQPAALLVLRDVTAERQMEKLRQDLSNMIVHDLRAPLTNMMVSVDLLLKQISGPLTASQQRIVQIAGTSSQQMLDLVNALLDIRRLEQRQLELQRQPVELFEVVEGVFERLDRVSDDRGIVLRNMTAALPPLSADIDLLRRVLQNLVDNATKFSPRNAHVHVSGYVANESKLPAGHAPGEWLVVQVADAGPGVPESYRAVIFELFGQAPQGRGQGSGLGLAFCKLAVAAHGGMIWVEDAPYGGALFRFTMPLNGAPTLI